VCKFPGSSLWHPRASVMEIGEVPKLAQQRYHSLTRTGPGYRGADSAMRAFQPLGYARGFQWGRMMRTCRKGGIRVRKLESHIHSKGFRSCAATKTET
jgi:hypothetical protein